MFFAFLAYLGLTTQIEKILSELPHQRKARQVRGGGYNHIAISPLFSPTNLTIIKEAFRLKLINSGNTN